MRLALTALTLAATLSLGLPAMPVQAADQRLDADGFERYTEGRTLSYSFEGQPYGIEQYLPGRRVRWAFLGDQCQDGTWYEREGMICFVYDIAPEEQCWSFYQTGDGLRAVFEGPDGPSTELYEVLQSDQPLTCQGPGVGV